jgi:hypothetical protein
MIIVQQRHNKIADPQIGEAMTEEAMMAYSLSRIYAQGWNHARTASPNEGVKANPYATEPERTRWNEGYAAASS